MNEPISDPRVFFAAERTLLAWLRTGLTIMVFGFVIARFGMFIQLLSMEKAGPQVQSHILISSIFGTLIVIAGSLLVLLSALHHKRFVASLPERDVPEVYSGQFAVLTCCLIATLGILLAVYLAVTTF